MPKGDRAMIDIKTCRQCGKKFSVLYPDLWVYKEGYQNHARYFCSWKCLRAFRGVTKGVGEQVPARYYSRDRMAIAREVLKEIEEGRSPIKYMETLGYTNPTQAFMDLKTWVRKKDPELGAKFPTKRKPEKQPETATVPTVKVDGPLRIETPETDKVEVVEAPVTAAEAMANAKDAAESFFAQCEDMGLLKGKISQPAIVNGMPVREVEGEFGRYRRSDIRGTTYIDFESTDRLDTISLTVDQWRAFRAETERAAAILGVEL